MANVTFILQKHFYSTCVEIFVLQIKKGLLQIAALW
jgi:hypothetical protein